MSNASPTDKKDEKSSKKQQPSRYKYREADLAVFLQFLNGLPGKTPEEKLKALSESTGDVKEEIKPLSIRYRKENGVYILNYDQINSPSFHPFVMVCRSLPLEYVDDAFVAVGRSYDRFPCIGENKEVLKVWLEKLPKNSKFHRVVEKKDGSIMMLFWRNGKWDIMTRGTMGSGVMGKSGVTFGTFFQDYVKVADLKLEKEWTYIFEVYDPEKNHVITRYEKPYVCLLDARKITGEYADEKFLDLCANDLKVERPEIVLRDATVEEINAFLAKKRLVNPLYEGVVSSYDLGGGKRMMFKHKDNWYHVFHKHMRQDRGPDLTEANVVMRLHLVNKLAEETKAQKVTEEEEKVITSILNEYKKMSESLAEVCQKVSEIKEQSKLASFIENHPMKSIIFMARKEKTGTLLENARNILMTIRFDWMVEKIKSVVQK